MSAVYSINGEVFATKSMILGWVVWSAGNEPQPLAICTLEQLEVLRKMFATLLYGEVSNAIQEEINNRTVALKEGLALIESVADDWNEAAARRLIMAHPATRTQPPEQPCLKVMIDKKEHQRALSKLALLYLANCSVSIVGTSVEALLRDNAIELVLREHGPNGNFLTIKDCPVLAVRPDDEKLACVIEPFIPFVE